MTTEAELLYRQSEAEEAEQVKTARLANGGPEDRVYGGAESLIHVVDGTRASVGAEVATYVDWLMRDRAEGRTEDEKAEQALCPGCYMVVMFNAMLTLAARNGQSPKELAASMRWAFDEVAKQPDRPRLIEEICVVLDPEG